MCDEMGQFSKEQKFFVILAIFVVGLLLYANGVAFNLISGPTFVNDMIAYGAFTVAVVLTVITLTIVIKNERKGVFAKTQIPNAIDAVKEPNETPGTVVSSKVDIQNINIVEAVPEQTNQPVKQLAIEPTKLICPACRKQFTLPNYLGDLMVDFGPRKPSNLISQCRHCGASIPLKQKNAAEENFWTE
jgi:hypothetical protein